MVVAGFPLDVARDEQIQVSIVVVIEPAGGDGPHICRGARKTGLRSDIFKSTVPAIAIESIAVESRHENVDIAIVVVVGRGDPHGITRAGQPSRLCHIGKGHIAVVAEQPVMKFRTGLIGGRKLGSGGEKNIHASIVVIVQCRHAA